MKGRYCLCLWLISLFPLVSQGGGNRDFAKMYAASDAHESFSIETACSVSNGIAFIGHTSADVVFGCFDANGDAKWIYRLGPTESRHYGYGLLEMGNNLVFSGIYSGRGFISCLTADGNMVWQREVAVESSRPVGLEKWRDSILFAYLDPVNDSLRLMQLNADGGIKAMSEISRPLFFLSGIQALDNAIFVYGEKLNTPASGFSPYAYVYDDSLKCTGSIRLNTPGDDSVVGVLPSLDHGYSLVTERGMIYSFNPGNELLSVHRIKTAAPNIYLTSAFEYMKSYLLFGMYGIEGAASASYDSLLLSMNSDFSRLKSRTFIDPAISFKDARYAYSLVLNSHIDDDGILFFGRYSGDTYANDHGYLISMHPTDITQRQLFFSVKSAWVESLPINSGSVDCENSTSTFASAAFEPTNRLMPMKGYAVVSRDIPAIDSDGVSIKAAPPLDGTVDATELRLREKPDLGSKTITFLKKGEKIDILEKTIEKHPVNDMYDYWYKVRRVSDGAIGWAYGRYIAFD